MNVRDVRNATALCIVRETALTQGLCSNMGDVKYPCVSRRTKLTGRGVHSEKFRGIGRR